MKSINLNQNQFRQGDVLMVYVSNHADIPADGKPVTVEPGQRVILAHGEVTGHTHALSVNTRIITPAKKPVFDAAAERYIQLLDSGKLNHEEHEVVILRPGIIEIGVQVEAGPHNMLRRVVD